MRQNALNVTLFVFLAGGLFFLWQYADKKLPKPEKKDPAKPELVEGKKDDAPAKADKDEPAKTDKDKDKNGKAPEGPKEPPKVGPAAPPPPPPEPPVLIALGDDTFYNRALLTTRGGGVQQVVLPRFDQADRLGREVKEKDADGNPTKVAVPLYLIPGVTHRRTRLLREEYQPPVLRPGPAVDPHLAEACYTTFHYPAPGDSNPDPLLGERNWKIVSEERPAGGEHKVVFETELGDPYFLTLRKIYTLAPKDYHIGLRIEIEKRNVPGAAKDKGKTRLQLSGPRGVPIEGEWYTSIYRVGVIGWRDPKGTARRQYEDAAGIGHRRGGEVVTRGDNTFTYAVVGNQYFCSGAAVNDRSKDEGAEPKPWGYVRMTTELPFDKKQDPNQPNFDDITFRAVSDELNLDPGQKIAHSYLIYNGPSKVRLLKLMGAGREVDPALVDRYKDTLTLQTITDFRSDTWLGWFANAIWWTDLVILFTNLMHWLLALIHSVTSSWALSIVVLTVCVRLLLMYPSRKQTAMSMRMMETMKRLQPEFDKLQEKYKDDMGSFQREKMRLMMQNGANPAAQMGGCLLMLPQMPIMMGLYFCLQESVFFRLDSFWWINNLAAPDMLIWWGENIPYISTPEDIGSFIYLGPFFNLLPILAVSLMLYQQAKMMPPSTDPQAEQQRMMMKMMMVMMALFFYKVAAGLALYFIVSTAWGIVERQLIPKPKIGGDEPKPGENGAVAGDSNLSPAARAAIEAARQQQPKGFLGRFREGLKKKMEEIQAQADEQAKRQIRNDSNRPDTGGSPQGGDNRRDKKKKRRK